MPTISITQSSTADGQIALSLSSADLPTGGFTFSLAINYTGANVHFSNVSYSGSAATSANAGYVGAIGTVELMGSLTPSPGMPFATILFDAVGKGTFDADITSFKINGFSAAFTDPAAYAFSILGETAALPAGGSASGTYKPLDLFFSPSYTVKSAPQHGSLVFGESVNPSAWNYTPATGFYGVDTFTLKVSDVFDAKEKTISVNVSPVGTANDDTFHSSAGTYHTDGGTGIDTLRFAGKVADFTVAKSGVTAVVTDKSGAEGVDYLDNFERLVFSDGAIALDIAGAGGQAYRIYQAAFNRTPDAVGLGFWMNAMDKGTSLADVANGFMHSEEFIKAYGAAPSNYDLVNKIYMNVLHRPAEAGGLDYWVHALDSHLVTSAQALSMISESAENQAAVLTVIGNGFVYTPYG